MNQIRNERAFTLIELAIVIVIIGILTTVAVREMSGSIEDAKYEHTKTELDHLAEAIVGNPSTWRNGTRSNFGYVGDIGALPPNLTALATNPGGYTTWNGPYIQSGTGGTDYNTDAWNVPYTFNGTSIVSTGSGTNISKTIATSTNDLLANSVDGYIVDANSQPPGIIYRDSVVIRIIYPNGTGGTTSQSMTPNISGLFSFSNIPIGNHTLQAIHLQTSDTMSYMVSVLPRQTAHIEIIFPADLW